MGQLTELSDFVARDLNMDDYDPYIFEQGMTLGGLYGLPSGVYTLFVLYNKDLFDKAGIPYPSSDWNNTWSREEFHDIARKLTQGTGATKQFGFFANLSLERSNVF